MRLRKNLATEEVFAYENGFHILTIVYFTKGLVWKVRGENQLIRSINIVASSGNSHPDFKQIANVSKLGKVHPKS